MSSRLDVIMDWENRAARAGFKVTSLAAACGITERQLRRHFASKFGCSPHSWMVAARLREARPLLLAGRLVKEVAADTGFRQQSHFSREFKRRYKVRPTEFRLIAD